MFSKLDILQVFDPGQPPLAHRAIRFAAMLASHSGARLFRHGNAPTAIGYGFYDVTETPVDESTADAWAKRKDPVRSRIILSSHDVQAEMPTDDLNRVHIQLAPWETEVTLITASGISNLYGEPDGPPLIPAGSFGAHTVGYAAFGALFAVGARATRFDRTETAIVRAADVWAWVNWKALISAHYDMTLFREGSDNFWPVLPCKDGFVAFLFRPTDLPAVVDMIDDPALSDIAQLDWDTLRKRRGAFFKPIRTWCLERTKTQIGNAFQAHNIPGAPLLTPTDLLVDPLLVHRKVFRDAGAARRVPVPPFRVESEVPSASPPRVQKVQDERPLSGFRVLDFGIIGAGSGTSALLADLGAEVIKIESPKRPDPFRVWAALPTLETQDDSPLFKSKNRNKTAVGIDLKSPGGLAQALKLVTSADIVLENYRRGVLDRLGLNFDALRAVNPTILLASISGMGLSGPGTQSVSFGSTLEANAGLGSLIRSETDQPYVSGPNLNYPDQIVNLAASAYVAAAAIDCRERSVAMHVDVSQRDCAIYQIGDVLGFVSGGGSESPSRIRRALGDPPLSGVFWCSDDVFVALSAYSPSVLDHVPGLTNLDDDSVADWARQRTSTEAIQCFLNAGGGGVRAPLGKALMMDPGLREREVLSHSPDGTLVQGFPFRLVKAPMTIEWDAPRVGQHNHLVLAND